MKIKYTFKFVCHNYTSATGAKWTMWKLVRLGGWANKNKNEEMKRHAQWVMMGTKLGLIDGDTMHMYLCKNWEKR